MALGLVVTEVMVVGEVLGEEVEGEGVEAVQEEAEEGVEVV